MVVVAEAAADFSKAEIVKKHVVDSLQQTRRQNKQKIDQSMEQIVQKEKTTSDIQEKEHEQIRSIILLYKYNISDV